MRRRIDQEEWGIKQDSEWQCSSDWLDKGCKWFEACLRYQMKVILKDRMNILSGTLTNATPLWSCLARKKRWPGGRQ